MPFHLPDEIPDASTLPVPSGAGATLPVPGQPDLARETARGTAMRGNEGFADAAPGFFARLQAGDPKTLRGVAVALFALSDAANRLSTGKSTDQAMRFLQQTEQLNLAKLAEARAERGDVRAAEQEARAAELFPMQKRAAQVQITAAQLGNMKGAIEAFDTLARRTSTGTAEAKQAATNEALGIWKNLGLEGVISESAVRNLMVRPDLLSSLTRYKPYLDQLPPGILDVMRQTKFDDPKDLKGLFDTLDLLVGQAAEQDALRTASQAIAALKKEGKTGPFSARDLALAFVDKPLAFDKLEGDRVAGRLAPDYVPGKIGLKATEETVVGPIKTAQKVTEAKALLAPELVEAEATAKARIATVVEKAKANLDITKPLTPGEASAVRQQFLTQAKDFSDTIRAYQRVEDAVKDPSAAGDIAVIFGYMKMLDPGSVVREGEFATASNAAGVPEQIRNTWNRLMTGQRLGEAGAPTREDIADRSRRLVQGQLELHEQTERVFRGIAKKRGGDVEELAPDLIGADLRKRIKERAGGRGAVKSDVIEFVRDPKTGRLVPKKK